MKKKKVQVRKEKLEIVRCASACPCGDASEVRLSYQNYIVSALFGKQNLSRFRIFIVPLGVSAVCM